MSGIHINYNLDGYGRSTLFVPVYLGNTEQVQELLQIPEQVKEINTGVRSQGEQTLLHVSCYGSSNVATVASLIKAGANIMALDNVKRLPLHMAANSAKLDIMQYLLFIYQQRNIAVRDMLDANKRSLLHTICCTGSSPQEKVRNAELVQSLLLLLNLYAGVEAQKQALLAPDAFGLRPVDYAKYFGFAELKEVFAEVGINWDNIVVPENSAGFAEYFGRNTVMPIVFSYIKDSAVLKEKIKSLQDLLNSATQDTDPNYANPQFGGRTVLHYAVGGGNPEIVTVVLDDLRTKSMSVDYSGNSAVHFAAHRGNTDVLLSLLTHAKHGDTIIKNINNTNIWGENPLHMLALSSNGDSHGHLACVDELVNRGVDLSARNKDLDTPAMVAKKRGNYKLAEKLEAIAKAVSADLDKKEKSTHKLKVRL